jgi:hypothetical protein
MMGSRCAASLNLFEVDALSSTKVDSAKGSSGAAFF